MYLFLMSVAFPNTMTNVSTNTIEQCRNEKGSVHLCNSSHMRKRSADVVGQCCESNARVLSSIRQCDGVFSQMECIELE